MARKRNDRKDIRRQQAMDRDAHSDHQKQGRKIREGEMVRVDGFWRDIKH